MTIDEQLLQKLQQKFGNDNVSVVNESHLHAGHMGDNGTGQTHYAVVIKSELFNDMKLLEQHRMVKGTVGDLISEGKIHALNIKTLKLI